MMCCVHSTSVVARLTREAGRTVNYDTENVCTGEATHETMEDGWKPLCAIHVMIYRENYPSSHFRALQFTIDEEPELV